LYDSRHEYKTFCFVNIHISENPLSRVIDIIYLLNPSRYFADFTESVLFIDNRFI